MELATETELIPANLDLPLNKYAADDKQWGDVITSGTFLPRVQLFGGNSDLVKQGKIGIGRFGLIRTKDSVEDLTQQFDLLPISWRFKAMRFADGNVLSYYDPKSPEFKKVMVDSDVQNSGCMFGIEFLIWIPSLQVFATFYFNSKTARRQAPTMKTIYESGKAATLKSEYIKTKTYSWHGPLVVSCSTPLTNLPTKDEIFEQAQIFANPKESEVEAVDAVTNEDRPR